MTAKEAIEVITNAIQTERMTAEQDRALAIAQQALEKQIPKKPKLLENKVYYECPCCKCVISKREGSFIIPFCKWCGQLLDWSDENERKTY